MDFSNVIKRLRDIMWTDPGVNGDAQRIEQIVWMLFLSLYDAKEQEWRFFDSNYRSIIPEKYQWHNWAVDNRDGQALTGDDLVSFINEMFTTLKNLDVTPTTPVRSRIVREVFTDLNNYMKDGIAIRQMVNVIDGMDLADFKNRHAFNEIYESILKQLQSAGSSGEFYTPRAITDFVTQMVNPRVGDTVADFACGTGGFLVSALKWMTEHDQVDDVASNQKLQSAFYGVEKKPLPYLLCTTNMLLHDINDPRIIHGNSLETNVRDYGEEDKFDVILMNPPYGGNEKKMVQRNFPTELADSETADLFMVEIMYRLKRDGRCGVVLPDGLLFGNDNTKTNVKRKLVEEFNLHTIIRLPGSVFAPYTGIATNLLFFDNTHPTERIWFYRMDMPTGRKAFNKTNPIQLSDMKPIRQWWNNRTEIKDDKQSADSADTYKSKCYSVQEIRDLNYNLDLCGYPQEEKVILSPEETITNFITKREELERQIDAQLNELKQMLGVK